jgi:hypothetical protein
VKNALGTNLELWDTTPWKVRGVPTEIFFVADWLTYGNSGLGVTH